MPPATIPSSSKLLVSYPNRAKQPSRPYVACVERGMKALLVHSFLLYTVDQNALATLYTSVGQPWLSLDNNRDWEVHRRTPTSGSTNMVYNTDLFVHPIIQTLPSFIQVKLSPSYWSLLFSPLSPSLSFPYLD